MSVVRTIISVPSQDVSYEIPGDWNEASIRASYAVQLPYLSNMVAATETNVTAEGTVRTVTFTARTGNKG